MTSGTGVSSVHLNNGTGVSPVPDSKGVMAGALRKRYRNLPHWQFGGSVYFITFRLASGILSEAEREIVAKACRFWHGKRMTLHLATIMPDHVHLILQPLERTTAEHETSSWYSLFDLLHSIKSFTSHEIQNLRGCCGPLWQDESFDRIIRNDEEYLEKWNYVWTNPVKAGLVPHPEDYPFTIRAP
ncbi:MAG: hypothetical protein L0Y44_12175 [Phycisphaerales bacterium]|nr:hypothetical protein [Phycisphaerales bacterium]MCI0631397.1 hypothetical protein [Phycisphaerales bacterium]